MSQVHAGRFTAAADDKVTVFLIGMRINQVRRVRKWWPVVAAMPPMLRHLATDPASGFLGYHSWFGRTTILLSYWRSPEHLQAFAADTGAPHLQPWRDFTRTVGTDGSVGIWHETYVTRAGGREGIYVNMPSFGLAAATRHVPVGAGSSTARQRLEQGSGAA